jgi:hypothetical protein
LCNALQNALQYGVMSCTALRKRRTELMRCSVLHWCCIALCNALQNALQYGVMSCIALRKRRTELMRCSVLH